MEKQRRGDIANDDGDMMNLDTGEILMDMGNGNKMNLDTGEILMGM